MQHCLGKGHQKRRSPARSDALAVEQVICRGLVFAEDTASNLPISRHVVSIRRWLHLGGKTDGLINDDILIVDGPDGFTWPLICKGLEVGGASSRARPLEPSFFKPSPLPK